MVMDGFTDFIDVFVETQVLVEPDSETLNAVTGHDNTSQNRNLEGRIYSACVQSVLIYGTETWAMKADDLRSLERTERMMVRWMCGVSLKDRKRSEDLYNLLGINCVADVVRHGRLRWFGHLERKSVDDWVSACRGLVVERTRGRGRSRKTWEQCVRDDMKLLGLHPEWAVFRDMWRDLIWGKRLTLA